MGFQFNHVGGGTKTRRPITLHMKYNSACVQPHCYLITDEFGEQEASLEELQVRADLVCGGGSGQVACGLHACRGAMACLVLHSFCTSLCFAAHCMQPTVLRVTQRALAGLH